MPPPMPLPMPGLGRAVLPSAVLGRGRGGGAGRARRGGDFVAAARRYPDVARLRAAVEVAEAEEREEEEAFLRRMRARGMYAVRHEPSSDDELRPEGAAEAEEEGAPAGGSRRGRWAGRLRRH